MKESSDERIERRGGRREGSGRKRVENKRVNFNTTISPKTLERADGICKICNVSRGELLDILVKNSSVDEIEKAKSLK